MSLLKNILNAVIILSLSSSVVYARNDGAVVGATLATVAIISLIASNDCKYEPYQNYVLNKNLYTNPGSPLVDYKTTVSKRTYWHLVKDIESVKGKIDVIVDKIEPLHINDLDNSTHKVNIANSSSNSLDVLSSNKANQYYVTFDKDGKLLSYDKEIVSLSNQDLGTTFFAIKNEISLTDKTFSQEIIYSGIIGNELHLTYREYQSDLMKAAFTQSLVFDLSKGKEITIRNYHFEIIEATNNYLIYKVL
ncbi:MAG: hypothetical protein WC665_01745 [Sulfurimonas sp.]|jgi:hypothetical protein